MNIHEMTASKQTELLGKIHEVVDLKRMEIDKLQKEVEALQILGQVLAGEAQPADSQKSEAGQKKAAAREVVSEALKRVQEAAAS